MRQAFSNLSENADDILNFINQNVTPDYENMLKTSEQYQKDVDFIDLVVQDFTAGAEEKSVSIEQVLKTIESVASSTE